ncbi:CAP domain-containing protein [Actinokineospora terrae]|uniref:CAP domain-containing protein n=1 Tax=Actinokineospora terrae TaxID=155974 RepID=UPI001C431EA0|nr:CAP domain-containing protein [Actinokineospora terrae]
MKSRRRVTVLAAAATGSALAAISMVMAWPNQTEARQDLPAALVGEPLHGAPSRPHPTRPHPGSSPAPSTSIPTSTTTTTVPVTTTTTTTTKPTTTKPTTTAPKPTTTTAGSGQPEELAVVEIVNARRAEAGCGPLRWNDKLATAARKHSQDMAVRGYFDHNSPDGRTPWDRIKAEGYTKASGENIAAGQATPEAVMTGWMNSPGHRANILNCKSTEIGVGMYKGGSYRIYWTQTFGTG